MNLLKKNTSILLIVGFALLIGVVHYTTFNQQAGGWQFLHIFLTKLYFLPVLLAAFRNGKRGALILSIMVTVVYLPHAVLHLSGSNPPIFENISEIALLWIVGGVAGNLSDKLRNVQHERSRLTAMKEISGILDVVNHDIMIDYQACMGLTRAFAKTNTASKRNSLSAQILLERLEHLGSHLGNLEDLAIPATLTKKKNDIVKIIKNSVADVANHKQPIEIKYSFQAKVPSLYIDEKKMTFAVNSILKSLINGGNASNRLVITVRKKLGNALIFFELYSLNDKVSERKVNNFDLLSDPRGNYALALAMSIIRSHRGKFKVMNKSEDMVSVQLSIPY